MKPANALAEYQGSAAEPYYIIPSAEGPYCTCIGWKISKVTPKTCKHLRDYLSKAGAGQPPAETVVLAPANPRDAKAPQAMNAHEVGKAPKAPWGDPAWVMDVKLDGERKLAVFGEDGRPTFYSRSGLSYKYAWAEAMVLPEGTILDGELVQAGGKSKWGGGGRTRVEYHVFDVLQVGAESVRDMAFDERREIVELTVEALDHPMVKALRMCGTPDKAEAEALMEEGYEGVMLKRRASRYHGGQRSWDWLKYKWTSTWDVVITDMDGPPSSSGHKNLRFGWYKDGKLTVCGSLGYIGTVAELAPMIGRVAEVKGWAFNEQTGAIRHPQFLRLRDDKSPEECVL